MNKTEYTATEVVCGWAGAVMKEVYSSLWAEAAMQKTPENAKKACKKWSFSGHERLAHSQTPLFNA